VPVLPDNYIDVLECRRRQLERVDQVVDKLRSDNSVVRGLISSTTFGISKPTSVIFATPYIPSFIESGYTFEFSKTKPSGSELGWLPLPAGDGWYRILIKKL
jgi:hypothetical protein